MKEAREQFQPGSSTVADFFGWINERTRIYYKRAAGQSKPWTDDPILQQYKFTNAFRELDRGTLALRMMEQDVVHRWKETGDGRTRREYAAMILFNTCWYRFFNLDVHAKALGMCDYRQLHKYMMARQAAEMPIFTGAHMVRGIGNQVAEAKEALPAIMDLGHDFLKYLGITKVYDYLALSYQIWVDRYRLVDQLTGFCTLQQGHKLFQDYFMLGDFTSYEIVCDLRWTLLAHAQDILTWGNVGNGAVRGLKRLGMVPSPESMIALWEMAPEYLSDELKPHHAKIVDGDVDRWGKEVVWPPFEIREIEHSLCEFDKYVRAKTGQGRPRSKYNGVR